MNVWTPCTLPVFADQDENKTFDQIEIVEQRTIELNETNAPDKVFGHVDINLTTTKRIDWVESIPAPRITEPKKSLFCSGGTIRSLHDPIFDENIVIGHV